MSLYLESGCGGPCAPCHDCNFYGYTTAATCPAGQKPVSTSVTDTPSGISIECTDCQPASCLELRGNMTYNCTVDDQPLTISLPVSLEGYSEPLTEDQCLALIAIYNEAIAACGNDHFAFDGTASLNFYGLTCYFCNVYNDAEP